MPSRPIRQACWNTVSPSGWSRCFVSQVWNGLLSHGLVSPGVHCVIGEQPMLPLLALTYTAARLGFEAQNAAAFRLLRCAGIAKATEEIVPEARVPPTDIELAPVATAPKRRHATKRIHKKS